MNIIEFELLDLLDKTKNIKYLREYIKKITDNKETINVEEFLLLKTNSKTILELLARNWDKLSVIYNTKHIKDIILNNNRLLKECIKIDFFKILKDIPSDIFQTKIDNVTLIEYLFENNKVSKNNIDILLPCENIFYYIKKYKREDVLENINLNKFKYIDELIDSKIDIKSSKLNIDIIKKIIEKEAYYLLSNLDEKELLNKVNNEVILEILLKNNVNLKEKEYENLKAIKIISKYKRYDLLQKTDPKNLVIEDYNGLYIIDEYLKSGYIPYSSLYEEANLVYYILKNNRKDLYSNLMYSTLVNNKIDDKLFLDKILDDYKQDNNIKLPKIIRTIPYQDIAKMYICYAKHGLEYLLPYDFKVFLSIDKETGKTLFEYLLEENELITKNILLPDLLEYEEFKLIIKVHEYKKQFPKIDKVLEDIEKEQKEKYKVKDIAQETEILVNELINVIRCENSDETLLELLKTNYLYLCSIDKKYLNEVKKLIELKDKIPHFAFEHDIDHSYYRNQRIVIDIPSIEILNHELGHLFFYTNANGYIPSEIDAIVFKIANDEKFINTKIPLFTKLAREIFNDVERESYDLVNKIYNELNMEKYRLEVEEYLNDIQLPGFILKSLNINPKLISSEEFILKDMQIKQKTIRDYILHCRYQGLLIISDIIDAVCEGKYFDKKLKDKNGEILKGIGGHGEKYYTNDKTNIFKEMIANYSSLIKLKESDKYIKLLRDIVGNELVEFLNTYYNENIIIKEDNISYRR